tara:strand:- start:224 stop:526 length:303 start_codon:yes stop_codon:yes gene_type:complete
MTDPRIIELEELEKFGSEDVKELAESDLFKERDDDTEVKTFADGGSTGFPDLTGDGKVTQKDILKGRGVKGFSKGMSVDAPNMSRGCGAVVRGKKFAGTF